MKTTIIVLSLMTLLAATAIFVSAKALYNKASNPEYKIVRDTVLIDPSRQRSGTCGEYQLELESDSIYVYDAQRLVAVLDAWNANIDSVLIADNE